MELTEISRPTTAGRLAGWNTTLAGRAALALAGSLFVALCAHAIVPLPFTPVPLTLGDLAVLLVGLALGPAMGFTALALYLAEGALGMPVFSPAGPGGVAQLFGATGGYLIAYPFAAALAGGLWQLLRKATLGARTQFGAALLAALPASALLMTSGVAWLAIFLHLSLARAFELGAVPFLPGQAVKVLAAAGIASSLIRMRRK